MFKERSKQKIKKSKIRCKKIENIQGLQDCVTKMIKRKELNIPQRIIQFKRKLIELKNQQNNNQPFSQTTDFDEPPEDIDNVHFLIKCWYGLNMYPRKQDNLEKISLIWFNEELITEKEEEIARQLEKIDIEKMIKETLIVLNYDEIYMNMQPAQSNNNNLMPISSFSYVRITNTKNTARTTQPLRQSSSYQFSQYLEQSYRTFSRRGK